MAILCHRWWPLQESVFFALEGEPVLDAGHALYCSTYYSRAVSVARSHSPADAHPNLTVERRLGGCSKSKAEYSAQVLKCMHYMDIR
jgi:hypothetical protein